MTTSEQPSRLAARHTAVLVERHCIMVEAKGGLLGCCREELIEECNARAIDWAEAHGMELTGRMSVIERLAGSATVEIGVEFDVIVGKGDISSDQRLPGVLDSWRWSGPRFEHWRRILNRADGREGRRIVAREEGKGRVIRFPEGGSRTGIAPRTDTLGIGCTCHLGGTFVDLCPIHFELDR